MEPILKDFNQWNNDRENNLKIFLMDALTGFEPVLADPGSAVLPLNYKASKILIILFKK